MIDNLMWIVTFASIVGTMLNIRKMRACFFIWLVTNSLWMIYDIWINNYPQAALFAVYVALAVWGIYSWRRK